eukprot:COSAG01_NODE_21831_length_882_cov_75.812261_1_plen_222_part_01
MAFHDSIRVPKSESECQIVLGQSKDGDVWGLLSRSQPAREDTRASGVPPTSATATASMSAKRFGELCHALDKEYPVPCVQHTEDGDVSIRMWRCGICSAAGQSWMQPKDRQPHLRGKRHQVKSRMLATRTVNTKDCTSRTRMSGTICGYSRKKNFGFIAIEGFSSDISFHENDVLSGRSELGRAIGKSVTFICRGTRALNLHIRRERERSRSRSRERRRSKR